MVKALQVLQVPVREGVRGRRWVARYTQRGALHSGGLCMALGGCGGVLRLEEMGVVWVVGGGGGVGGGRGGGGGSVALCCFRSRSILG